MSNPEQESIKSNPQISSRRRRLLAGTLAGSGVLLSIQAKTALGGTTCQSPSAQISGNTSPRPNDRPCSGGRSPGFWVTPQHFPHWAPSGLSYPSFYNNIVPCSSGLGNVSPCDIKSKGTLLGALFSGAPGGDKGVWEVLMWPTNYPTIKKGSPGSLDCKDKGNADVFNGKGQLLRHLVSAYLNASYFEYYPITKQQVIEMWNAVGNGGLYCPNGISCGINDAMSASQIISYIEGMYDYNSDVPNLCKQN